MNIGIKQLGDMSPALVIAEAGVNHNNNLSLALKMVDIAKKSGADAIKFQSWKTEKLLVKNAEKPKYQKSIKDKNYFQLLKTLEPNQKDQKKIFDYCKKRNILFLSTPYDEESVDFLNDMGVLAFKISSSDLSNHILLEHICKKKKPIILSTGLSTMKEVDSTIKFITKKHMKNKTILLQATSSYPTENNEVNLKVISTYKKRYQMLVGLSDHTKDEIASLGAIAIGACVIEKHFTTDRKQYGPDQSSSLTPVELKTWVDKIRKLEKTLGSSEKNITKSEKMNLSMRKVLMIKPKKKGEIIKKQDIIARRVDGKGIPPTTENLNKILNRKLKKDIKEIKKMSWEFIL
mgnify:CR=1 FL=1